MHMLSSSPAGELHLLANTYNDVGAGDEQLARAIKECICWALMHWLCNRIESSELLRKPYSLRV